MIIGVEYDAGGLGITDFVFDNKLEALTKDQLEEVLESLETCKRTVEERIGELT
jgi:hypothetical protein